MTDQNDELEITVLPPPLFNYDADDLLGEWKQWFQKLEEYLIAYDRADSPDEEKIRVLLNHLGNEGKEIYESLEAKDSPGERITSFNELTEAIGTYFDSARNVLFGRFKFFKLKRKPGQSISEFVNELETAADCCEFAEKENLIRDKLLEQLKDRSLIERLLVEGGSLKLERAVKICQKWENRKLQANENIPPDPGNYPESDQPTANNLGRRKSSAKPLHPGALPVITILGVVPQEDTNTVRLNTAVSSDEDRDFWDGDDPAPTNEEESRPARGPGGTMCEVCGKLFKRPAALKKHMETHSGLKPYACTKCDYRGALKASLQSHMRMHGGYKFSCDQCDFKARRSYNLKMHKRIHHTGERPFTCEICGKRFIDRGSINFHLRTRHLNSTDNASKTEKLSWNFACDTCGRKFVMEEKYKAHIAAHKNGEPYQCYACDFKAFTRTSIIRHLSNRHGEKTYSCTHCGYRTAMKSDYTDHTRTHSGIRPFVCGVCDFSAATRATLRSHMRMHSDKNMSCEFCDYKTSRKQSLTGHMRRHTGDRPYECSFCGYRAAQRATLTKHVEVIHNKIPSRRSKSAAKSHSDDNPAQTVAPTIQTTQPPTIQPPTVQNDSPLAYQQPNNAVLRGYLSYTPQQHNYHQPPPVPAPPTVYMAQNNYYPATYYNNNTNSEIVHNNSPFDLDQFVRSNMIN